MLRERQLATEGEPLGVQLYPINVEFRTEIDGLLATLADIGYRTVELTEFAGWSPAELRVALDRAELRCISSYVGARCWGPRFVDVGALAADAHVLGSDTLVMSDMSKRFALAPKPRKNVHATVSRIARAMTTVDWQATTDVMNSTGAALRRHGLRFSYRPHIGELEPFGTGTVLDFFLGGTDPELVKFQLDVGWAVSAGVDPARLLAAYPSRFTALYLRDVVASTVMQQEVAEIGRGAIDWPRLIAVARTAGIKRFLVEQEAPFACPPLQSLQASFNVLAHLLT